MKKITKETTIKDILQTKGNDKILEKFHLPCLHCPMAAQEIEKLKIGQVATAYGIDIKKLLKEINVASLSAKNKKPTKK